MASPILPTDEQLETAASRLFSRQQQARLAASETLRQGSERSVLLLHRILIGTFANRLHTTYASDLSIPRFTALFTETYNDAARLMAASGKKGIGILIDLLASEEELIRNAAANALAEIALDATEVDQILPLVQSKRKSMSSAATISLSQSSDHRVVDEFTHLLRNEVTAQRRKQTRRKQLNFVLIFSYAAAWGLHHWYPLLEDIVVPIFFFGVIFSSGWAVSKLVSKRGKTAFSAVAGKADARMLGTLVHLLHEADDDIRSMAQRELIRILPQVKATDRQYLTDEEMKLLLKPLGGNTEPFILALLKGLEQIGDERALPYVERLARNQGTAYTGTLAELSASFIIESEELMRDRSAGIQAAARACLPFLHQRIQDSVLSSTLLRASEQNAPNAPLELLRPAVAGVEHHEAELLRPSVGV